MTLAVENLNTEHPNNSDSWNKRAVSSKCKSFLCNQRENCLSNRAKHAWPHVLLSGISDLILRPSCRDYSVDDKRLRLPLSLRPLPIHELVGACLKDKGSWIHTYSSVVCSVSLAHSRWFIWYQVIGLLSSRLRVRSLAEDARNVEDVNISFMRCLPRDKLSHGSRVSRFRCPLKKLSGRQNYPRSYNPLSRS